MCIHGLVDNHILLAYFCTLSGGRMGTEVTTSHYVTNTLNIQIFASNIDHFQ